jgi:hypothetical protein
VPVHCLQFQFCAELLSQVEAEFLQKSGFVQRLHSSVASIAWRARPRNGWS